jgi:hypothetical protein
MPAGNFAACVIIVFDKEVWKQLWPVGSERTAGGKF